MFSLMIFRFDEHLSITNLNLAISNEESTEFRNWKCFDTSRQTRVRILCSPENSTRPIALDGKSVDSIFIKCCKLFNRILKLQVEFTSNLAPSRVIILSTLYIAANSSVFFRLSINIRLFFRYICSLVEDVPSLFPLQTLLWMDCPKDLRMQAAFNGSRSKTSVEKHRAEWNAIKLIRATGQHSFFLSHVLVLLFPTK